MSGNAVPSTAPAPDFFISYTEIDLAWAVKVGTWLEDAGYHVIIQAWDFRPGHNFEVMMQKALRSRHTLAILSPDYLESQYCQQEWAAALREDPTSMHRKLIPIRVKACNPRGLLGPIIYIDLVGKNGSDVTDAQARKAVLAGIADRAKPGGELLFSI